MTTDYAALEEATFNKKRKHGYANAEPITDPMEALALLFTDFFHVEDVQKRLMPFAVLGPRPRGVSIEEHRHMPFIEHSWNGGRYGLEFSGIDDYLVSHEVAHQLMREDWVEETSIVNVCKISLLGSAVYATRRKSAVSK